MTLDRTLKQHGGVARARSVLTRTERIARLIDEEKFDSETDSPLGLPKTKVRHSRAGMKSKKADPEAAEAAAAEGDEEAKEES
jgi:small basic protein (TIGR04137 family)